MKISKRIKRILILLIVVIIGGAIWFSFSPKEEKVTYITETVGREDLVQTVDVSGEVRSIDEVELAFDISGTLNELFVEISQEVQAGDVLARLDTTELEANVQTSLQAVQVARANLEKARAGSTSEAQLVAQESVNIAETGITIAEQDLLQAQESL